MGKFKNCLLISPSKEKCRKNAVKGYNRMARVGFEPRLSRSQPLRFNAI